MTLRSLLFVRRRHRAFLAAVVRVALMATLGGCYMSFAIDDGPLDAGFDAGRDTGPPDVGVDAPPDLGCTPPYTFECCNFGMYGCRSNVDCTDPGRPFCVDAPGGMNCAAFVDGCDRLCASPDTPIATPDGERPIAELEVGALVYSIDYGAVRAVPVVRRVRNETHDHAVVHVQLASGRTLEISPGHPTADGRTFADLAPGGTLGGVSVLEVETIPYGYDATYDILPASDTGTYFAAGVLVGSTLFTNGR